jgi:hypothetical protein
MGEGWGWGAALAFSGALSGGRRQPHSVSRATHTQVSSQTPARPAAPAASPARLPPSAADALVVGLASGGSYRLNPPPETVVGPGDDVIALRPERWGGPPASSMPSRRMPALLPLHLS